MVSSKCSEQCHINAYCDENENICKCDEGEEFNVIFTLLVQSYFFVDLKIQKLFLSVLSETVLFVYCIIEGLVERKHIFENNNTQNNPH